MIDGGWQVLTVLAVVGCGIVAGAFFAFSTFVMPALRRLPPAQGVAAMQAINVTAVRPAFLAAVFGTALGCLVLVVVALVGRHQPYAVHLLAGGVIYLLGAVGTTMIVNVPLNDALARPGPAEEDVTAHWTRYLRRWTRANHVRTGASLAATVLLILALCAG